MSRRLTLLSGILIAALLSSCALLPTGSKKRSEKTYLIAPDIESVVAAQPERCGVIQVGIGPAVTGQRGASMVYSRNNYELSYYAFSRWGDAPARMLRDQLRGALRASGAFAGVLVSPVATETNYQLELADVSVVQRFDTEESSQLEMRFDLRMYDGDRRHLLAEIPLQGSVAAGGDAQSGVEAANLAAADLLRRAVEVVLERCDRGER